MKKWNELPKVMQNDKVKYYYDILQEHEKESVSYTHLRAHET